MERISKIQKASVITQPTDATERLTLIEKLEQEVKRLLELKAEEKPDSLEYMFLGHHIVATVNAINIVERHSEWIPVSELPKEEKDWLVRFRKEDGFGLTMAVSKFYLEAQRFDCFHSKVTHYMELPKPPSEVQDD